jgi:hypothetical protein
METCSVCQQGNEVEIHRKEKEKLMSARNTWPYGVEVSVAGLIGVELQHA